MSPAAVDVEADEAFEGALRIGASGGVVEGFLDADHAASLGERLRVGDRSGRVFESPSHADRREGNVLGLDGGEDEGEAAAGVGRRHGSAVHELTAAHRPVGNGSDGAAGSGNRDAQSAVRRRPA